ncbi:MULTISPECIES: helix-turn-helix domain-containing protein [Staphylococcus]|uniref:Helix-turn-helix domain-containing protein n=1 Tax=Staphylococcus xylosus TaxID=1288 RepID=A0A418IP40_STAXY|nr:helix-turn-helix domain-containing protein [Staphylococcus xylosus]MBF0814368.1 helix-turn-helix domain-containing protein [Staphylococcus saprophyticus]MDW8543321.1 helix-turn-helix domain-containing protein [Staphylococcus sp. KG4-1]MRF36651.1 helix-turn-helix domain-containing protein [Staphylococcus sp. KY49P]NQD99097.1 helix-turn-helix domain-containing protein [Staphylococcus xylosus]PTI09051.1 helix-turn-helix domain-containing protein [Staphylococcus xylosus]
MDFGNQIKLLRKKIKLTQSQLANELNVSRQTISAWENNRYLPDIEMIVIIAKKFDLSLDDLILGDDAIKNKLVSDGSNIKRIRLSILSLIFILIGILSAFLFLMLPSYVSHDGVLHEPWFLVPLSFFTLVIGLLVGLLNLFLIFFNYFKSSKLIK